MHDTDDLADTLKSFWFFMLIFSAVLAALIGYVNLLGYIEKLELKSNVIITKQDITPENERKLGIFADIDEIGVSAVPAGKEVVSASGTPYFEFRGDGLIEVAYSNDSHGFLYAPKNGGFSRGEYCETYIEQLYGSMRPRMMAGENYVRLRDSFCFEVVADYTSLVSKYGSKAKYFKNVSVDMREYCTIDNQVVGEVFARELHERPDQYMGPPDYAVDFSRNVYISHVFITLYDETYRTVAAATVRIKSRGPWILGSRKLSGGVLVECGATTIEDAYENTTLEVISYWQEK